MSICGPNYIDAREMVIFSGPLRSLGYFPNEHSPGDTNDDDMHPFSRRIVYVLSAVGDRLQKGRHAFKFDVSTELISDGEEKLFVDPTMGYDIPKIIQEISPSLLRLKSSMRVGVSFLDGVIIDESYSWRSALNFCHPSKAKYLFLAIQGGEIYDPRHKTNASCSMIGENLVVNYPGRSKLGSISLYHFAQITYESRRIGPFTYLFTGGSFYCFKDFPCHYVDYWILPMGYSRHEPLDPDLAIFARQQRTKEYQEIALKYLTDKTWCAEQRRQYFQGLLIPSHAEEYFAAHKS